MLAILNPLRRYLRNTGRRTNEPIRITVPAPTPGPLHDPATFHFRPGTMDEAIYHEVLSENTYRLPASFAPTDLIVDVGAHIGSFAAACLARGAGTVVSFEAEESNAALARRNLAPFGRRADVRRQGVWRSDEAVEFLTFAASTDPTNTGGGSVAAGPGIRVPVVPFARVLHELTAGGRRIRLLKLDCEGSEFPILLTAPPLDTVDEICGEFHLSEIVPPAARVAGRARYRTDDIRDCLTRNGFTVEFHVNPRNPAVGEFFARRK